MPIIVKNVKITLDISLCIKKNPKKKKEKKDDGLDLVDWTERMYKHLSQV